MDTAEWDDGKIAEVLKNSGTKIENPTQDTEIFPETTVFPGIDNSNVISADEAIRLVERVMSKFSGRLIEELFDEYYEYEVETVTQDGDVMMYVVVILIDGNDDGMRYLVPLDGSAVWLGTVNSDGGYLYYGDLDLLHASYSDMIEAAFNLSGQLAELLS